MPPIVKDKLGNVQTWDWLRAKFGDGLRYEESACSPAYKLAEVHERSGPVSITVTVLDEDGHPLSGIQVLRHWPSADPLPPWDPPPERWKNNGIHAPTVGGQVGFEMGPGDWYNPAAQAGATSIWIGDPGVGSDVLHGIGMVGLTEHDHPEPVFQKLSAAPPPPDPGDEPTGCLYYLTIYPLEQLAKLYALIRDIFAQALQ